MRISSDGERMVYSDGEPLTSTMDNVLASRLGKVLRRCQENGSKGIGDSIDAGLILRLFLEEAGFRVTEADGVD